MEKITKKQSSLVNQLAECRNMMKGSITAVCSRCNRANCTCKNKLNRKAYRLTFKDKNQKTQILYVPKKRLDEVKRMLKNYSKSWAIIDQLIYINIKLFKLNKQI